MNCQSLNGVLNVAEEVNEELEVDANNRRGVMSVLEGVGLSKSQEPLCFPKRQIPARNSDTLLECEGSSLGVELGCMENQISDSSKAELVVNTKENENLSEGLRFFVANSLAEKNVWLLWNEDMEVKVVMEYEQAISVVVSCLGSEPFFDNSSVCVL
ncbi:unnamed protein product [Ilex paraguariensis]|uniref:Uncharacterized protein n=1 Tax=Ilex paraguariensis TaxID=185542 RepID=A0ABC8TQZ0_9AQUA